MRNSPLNFRPVPLKLSTNKKKRAIVVFAEILQVKFSVFKDGEEKQFIIFNGTGTNHENWFDAARILNSSWIDLKYKSFIHFSLRG